MSISTTNTEAVYRDTRSTVLRPWSGLYGDSESILVPFDFDEVSKLPDIGITICFTYSWGLVQRS